MNVARNIKMMRKRLITKETFNIRGIAEKNTFGGARK
jgi:hypothetical protein